MDPCFNSMSYDRDSGHKSFLEDVFENESRLPAGNWGPSSVPWTDVVSVLSYVYHLTPLPGISFYLLLSMQTSPYNQVRKWTNFFKTIVKQATPHKRLLKSFHFNDTPSNQEVEVIKLRLLYSNMNTWVWF